MIFKISLCIAWKIQFFKRIKHHMCKAVLCMWWQLVVLPIKTTVITCMLHKQTTIVSLYMYIINAVVPGNSCETLRNTHFDAHMCLTACRILCVSVHKFKIHAWKKRVQRTLGQRTLDIWQRMFDVSTLIRNYISNLIQLPDWNKINSKKILRRNVGIFIFTSFNLF